MINGSSWVTKHLRVLKKNQGKSKKLFLGKNANICDECVKIAFNFKNGNTDEKLVKHHLLRNDFHDNY